jgi:carbon monoxide dehydrogenase subunit G
MRIENTITIDAPVAEVWDLTVDVEGLSSVTPTITSVERLDSDPLAVGSRVKIVQPRQPDRVWTVTHLDAGRVFAWSTKAMGMTMTGRHELMQTDQGTKNVLTLDLEDGSAAILSVLLKRSIRKALEAENLGIKNAAEA